MSFDKFNFISYSNKGLKRENNEDALLTNDEDWVFAVADGLGGHQAGEIASNEAITILGRWIPGREDDIKAGLSETIEKANSRILELAEANPSYEGMGTTLSVLTRYADYFFIAHVGDSRIYQLHDNILLQVTKDHTLAEELKANGNLPDNFGPSHSSNHILTRALGTKPDLEIDLKEIKYCEDDMFFLCTDGVTKHLSDGELKDIMTRNRSDLYQMREEVIDAVLSRGATDNFTFIIIRF